VSSATVTNRHSPSSGAHRKIAPFWGVVEAGAGFSDNRGLTGSLAGAAAEKAALEERLRREAEEEAAEERARRAAEAEEAQRRAREREGSTPARRGAANDVRAKVKGACPAATDMQVMQALQRSDGKPEKAIALIMSSQIQ
jgi:hypothetical protein